MNKKQGLNLETILDKIDQYQNELDFFKDEEQEPNWKQEWKDMPEFVQVNKEPCQKIVINFQTYDDVKQLAELLGFSVTNKTKSIWFPIKEKDKPREYAYVDTDK